MPFRKWDVQPVYLARTPVAPDKKSIGFEFETVLNGCLVKCLHQLKSVAQIADCVFEEIGSECRQIQERSEKIQGKLHDLQGLVENLNARAVSVPCADLDSTSKFLRRTKPYKTVYQLTTQIYLPSNRPPCIDKLYNDACVTPVSLMCTLDQYRTDSCSSSQLFMVTPVLGGVRKKRRKMLDIETRKPASFSLDKSEQENKSAVSMVPYTLPLRSTRDSISLDYLPSPEEQALAKSLEYPSSVIPVDISGSNFVRMTSCRRSLIHVDFVIKRKKGKHRSKRRHTICEGDNKKIEEPVQNIELVNSSCQTDDVPETSNSFFSFRSFRRKSRDITRRETVALDGLNLDYITNDKVSKVASDQSLGNSSKKSTLKKSGKSFLLSKAANFKPISTISAAISMAVKMRNNKAGKQDDGRSSSGNWSATSSTRASVDSDQHHLAVPLDRTSNVSRCSAGKDSVISDSTQQEVRYSDCDQGSGPVQNSRVLMSRQRTTKSNGAWTYDQEKGRESNASTPERSSDCASTPIVLSPVTRRKKNGNIYHMTSLDDGESSVYSVDTDGYYTSMHTDSGLSNNFLANLKISEGLPIDSFQSRKRQESQSSVSTIGNSSINSFLSRTVTENSSSNNSLKEDNPPPQPPPRVSSSKSPEIPSRETDANEKLTNQLQKFDKECSPTKNCSASESDYEVGDRIRVKTTINSSRYPSMCAVSPETSDDEMGEIKSTAKSSTVNVVAEIHQTEVPVYERSKNSGQNRQTQAINMYGGSQSPSESSFSSGLSNNQLMTSTPKKYPAVTSFASDTTEAFPVGSSSSYISTAQSMKQTDESLNKPKDTVSMNTTMSPENLVGQQENKNLIPLKYAQCITVTPIMRTDSTQVRSADSATTRSRSFLKNPLSNFPFLQCESTNSKSSSSPSYISFQSPDSPVSSSNSLLTPESPRTKEPPSRNVARVTLDPMGRVIYSSSSLERNSRESPNNSLKKETRCQTPLQSEQDLKANSVNSQQKHVEVKTTSTVYRSATPTNEKFCGLTKDTPVKDEPAESDGASVPKMQNLFFRPSRGGRFCRTYFPSHLINLSPGTPKSAGPPPSGFSNRPSDKLTPNPTPFVNRFQRYTDPSQQQKPDGIGCDSQSKSYQSYTMPSYAARSYLNRNPNAGTYLTYASTVAATGKPISNQSNTMDKGPLYTKSYSQLQPAYPQKQESKTPSTTLANSQPKYSFLSRDSSPKTDFLKCIDAINACKKLIPEINGNNTKLTECQPSNPPDVIPSSSTPPSTLDITSRTGNHRTPTDMSKHSPLSFTIPELKPTSNQTGLKSLSPTELFAIIHNSKKKHNIRTESEKSLSPMSSRSSSPGFISPIKTQRIETGVLSKQQENREMSASDGNLNEHSDSFNRSELATDRLGPAKPTSMHDFKMLLSQTRAGGNDPNTRPSAAELLKVSPPRNSTPVPVEISQRPSPKQNTKLQHSPGITSLYGHSTVPVKRAIRTRSPYLTRYDSAYPPIWEDMSEETEAADENQNQKCFSPNKNANSFTQSESFLNNNTQNSKSTSTWV